MGLKNGLFCSWLAHGCRLLVPACGARLVASSASLGVSPRFIATSSGAQTPQSARGLRDGRRYYVDMGNHSCVAISCRLKWSMVMVRRDRLRAACFRALLSVSELLSIAVLEIGNVSKGSEPDSIRDSLTPLHLHRCPVHEVDRVDAFHGDHRRLERTKEEAWPDFLRTVEAHAHLAEAGIRVSHPPMLR